MVRGGSVMRSVTIPVLVSIYGGLVLLGAPLSAWLLLNAQTWTGRGLAVAGMIVIFLPITLFLWYRGGSWRGFWGWGSMSLGLILVGILTGIVLSTPTGHPQPDSPVQHRFTQGGRFRRYTLTNVVPEMEQINLGFLIMPYLDPILTRDQACRVSTFTLDLYRDMERDRDFHQLGSAMGWAYAEFLGRPFDVGHYYLYVPRKRGSGPSPAIVFLHGSAGNFKAYTWVWSKLAEEQGMVIIAPSFGFGNWDRSGVASVLQALDDAATVVDINQDQVYLAGLSNGGLGVSQLAEAAPERFRGLIFISPVMETKILDGTRFHHTWRDRPVLVVTGEADRRIPVGYVEQRVSNLRAGGVQVTEIIYPDEDHFLFFSQPENVLGDISSWLLKVGE
jgi:pimeloyl-ACP methyl ester carboxylesterase